ncbi:lytic transglycosylase domain-containing protein [Ochrobactrum sp. BTU1]|uniref:lytic transglycosylase domain-containing protein n=1 Tax=Ochrobactrum sp. BTU1 TaxID=2840456 RepID=UPI001C05D39C|nr:lytic transglycosylase domain-containing protein [Ochrobactrum sp. BTU1]
MKLSSCSLATLWTLLLALNAPAYAFFGKEVFDSERFIEETAKLDQSLKDLKTQYHRFDQYTNILKSDDQIISELDKLIDASALPKDATRVSIENLERGANETKGVESNLYNPQDTNPAASKAFGDASLTVEQVIIQGARETYSLSGVSIAGLSQPQWRALLQALIWQESRFNPFIGSKAGAFGLTQLIRGTAQEMGVDPQYKTEPLAQVRGGAKYLAKMLAMFKGNIVHALAGYNAGPGSVLKYGGVPPFAETQNYVVVIPKKYNEYLAKIGGLDAEGTIEPALAAGANYAMASDALRSYGDNSAQSVSLIARRLKDIIEQMKANENPAQAWVLNSYARAEMARIMALRTRMAAIQTRQISALALQEAADRAEEREFFNFEGRVQ